MRHAARFAIEMALLFLLAGFLLLGAITVVRQLVTDEKVQYFCIGYYAAIHGDLVRWI